MDIKELVDLCKEGDELALGLLYKTYSGKMMKICLHYVPDKQIAQDLLHDGFIVIFTSIDSLRTPEKLESWMGVIMKNISLRYLNQNSANTSISLSDIAEEEEPVDNPPLSDSIPYDKIAEMVEKLPEGYSKVFKLAILEGLSHKEIGKLLNIAPHSSSSQLFRAKGLLKKMISDYKLILILVILFLFPMIHDYLDWKRRDTKANYWAKNVIRKSKIEKKPENENTISSRYIPHYKEEERYNITLTNLPRLASDTATTISPAISERKDSADKQPAVKPSFIWEPADQTIAFSYSSRKFASPPKKKAGKWKIMLAGSVGPQLAQNLYKLIATPHSDGLESGLPQQVNTWEEYYDYLNTRHQEGTLGDSLTLMTIAKNNSGRIIEHQHHDAPITFGLSFNKKLSHHWSIETGLQYTYLKSEFTTGKEYRIQETQKLHYIGIPFRISYRLGNYKRLSFYSTAGFQMEIPLKSTLHTSHVTDSVPISLGYQTLEAPLQWSVNASAGVQYQFTPHTSIYIEPTINYYIPDGSSLRTIRKEHPVTFTVPVGIRFSW